MPDNIERKRLKKKMLERWENEGGRIATDSVKPNQSDPAGQHEGEGSSLPASNDSSRGDRMSSRKRRGGVIQK